MSRWFRHYAGMMRDDKLVRVAIRASQTIERVVWIYGAILESAAEIDDNGRYDFDAAEAAYFLRSTEEVVNGILDALEVAGRVADGRVVKWGDRQFTSDRSAERQRRYRERQKNSDSDVQPAQQPRHADGRVTSLKRDSDAPETETETETEDTPNGVLSELPFAPSAEPDDKLSIEDVVESWNTNIAARYDLPKCMKLTGSRKASIRARLRESSFEEIDQVFGAFGRSRFLRGEPDRTGRRMRPDLGWVMNATNFVKIMEGKYDD